MDYLSTLLLLQSTLIGLRENHPRRRATNPGSLLLQGELMDHLNDLIDHEREHMNITKQTTAILSMAWQLKENDEETIKNLGYCSPTNCYLKMALNHLDTIEDLTEHSVSKAAILATAVLKILDSESMNWLPFTQWAIDLDGLITELSELTELSVDQSILFNAFRLASIAGRNDI